MSLAPIEQHWVQQPGTHIAGVVRPTTLLEALELLAGNLQLRPVAGGTDLVLELDRSGSGGSVNLLDLTLIQGLDVLDFEGDQISIGAGVRHADILASDLAAERMLALAQACLEVGSPQLRNRATIAGNLVTASPANDTISALLALDAMVVIASAINGAVVERSVALGEFYTGFRSTVLQPGELVSRIMVPQPSAAQRTVWVKAGLRKAQAISVVHAGFNLDFDAEQNVTSARISLGSVGPTVELNQAAQAVLIGGPLTPGSIERAARAAVDSVTPIDDGRATAAYRSDMVHTVVARALTSLADGSERDRWPDQIPLLASRLKPAVQAGNAVAVNGALHVGESAGQGTLLDWLRETAGTGTKEGCAEGECGACTVHLDGDAVMSCLVPAAQAQGSTIVTIEGLGGDGDLDVMQQSFLDKFAVQCGYCIPGFVMAARQLADEFDSVPTRDQVELALSGNLCRCTGYYNIIDAVTAAIAQERT